MSALQEIRARLAAATPGPWANYGNLGHEVYAVNAHEDDEPGYIAEVVPRKSNAEFIAHAPTDMARLLAAVEAVEALATGWEARGTHDMNYSKTIPDEDIAMEILTNGAAMVEYGRHIRVALTAALEAKQ